MGQMPEICPEHSSRHFRSWSYRGTPPIGSVSPPTLAARLFSLPPLSCSLLADSWGGCNFPHGPSGMDHSLCPTPGQGQKDCVPTSLRQGHPSRNPQALSRSAVLMGEPRSCTRTTWVVHGG